MIAKTRTTSRPGFGTWKQSRILNAWVDALTIPEIIDRLDEGMLFTVNPDHLYHLQRNPDFAAAYSDAVMVSADSKYVYWALALFGRAIKCKTSGSDIVPAYYKHHANNPDVTIYFLGAKDGIAQQAQKRVNQIVGRNIVVGAHGPSFTFVDDDAECAEAVRMVNASGATTLIVGIGSPKQEVWIHKHRHLMPGVKVYMGVGAVIDYEADAVKRAPAWMNRNGLEWVYRITTQPIRYWRRYARTLEFFWLAPLDWLGFYRMPKFLSPATKAVSDATPVLTQQPATGHS
jgi:N-acetylglucosaminyldiphosphoundecaprenol N-acetyl-beta-D-mannosaminyltransferase